MSAIKSIGTIFIKEKTQLPETLTVESDAFLPGWRIVRNVDRFALARKIEKANWNFFYLAGRLRATVVGRNRSETLRKAVKCVLAKPEAKKFNSLEIANIVAKRFLGIPFMTVTAHPRHIQEGIGLVIAKDFVLKMPAAPKSWLDTGGEHSADAATPYVALISSS